MVVYLQHIYFLIFQPTLWLFDIKYYANDCIILHYYDYCKYNLSIASLVCCSLLWFSQATELKLCWYFFLCSSYLVTKETPLYHWFYRQISPQELRPPSCLLSPLSERSCSYTVNDVSGHRTQRPQITTQPNNVLISFQLVNQKRFVACVKPLTVLWPIHFKWNTSDMHQWSISLSKYICILFLSLKQVWLNLGSYLALILTYPTLKAFILYTEYSKC